MSAADVVAAGSFLAIFIAGLALRTLVDMAQQRPTARIKRRVAQLQDPRFHAKSKAPPMEKHELLRAKRGTGRSPVLAAIESWSERVQSAGGANGLRNIVCLSIAVCVACGLGAWLLFSELWLAFVAGFFGALLGARIANVWVVVRFRQRFLAMFPDTLDLIIRAVRAGIPVVQAICTAGSESEQPVRETFRAMGDALLVGAELKDVLEDAARRLQLADFSFFSVCLILQRETGGNLGDTLENLASIIRARRDLRSKSKALTAEGRLASKMIAAVPFAIAGFLYLVNRPYLEVLTGTRAGHKILALATVLMVVGLGMIRKIANLDTSR